MKQFFTTLALCLSVYSMMAFNVTFRLDMGSVTGFTTPEVNGTFNNWCGACAPLADPDMDGIWEITIPLAAGTYEYKYAYDNWTNPEVLAPGSSCTVTNFGFTNRSLVVTGDIVLPIVCYGACTTCDQIIPARTVTFRVDMNGVTGYTSPQLNGTFNNWCGNCAPMADTDGDGIYELTLTLPQATYEYKFTYDNWAGIEPLVPGSPCTMTTGEFTNRLLVLTDDIVLDAVCWGSCTTCAEVTPNYNVTFNVDMNGVTGFTTPEVNGTWNGWCGNCNPLTDSNGDGIWTTTIAIPEGAHEFKYAYDNWAASEQLTPGSSCTITTGEFTNRSLNVTSDMTLDVVCWASCTACNVEPVFYDVTFNVDMSGVTGFTTPEVNGTWNAWCGNCNPLSDADGDGIWSTTISILEGTHEFKYGYDNWAASETLAAGSSCTITTGEFTNRVINVNSNLVLDVVCWASCNACNVVVANYDVTFRVDMNGVTGFTTPEVNGTFNNWCGNCNPMSDGDGDGIWEATLSIPEGTHEFKYAYDNWAGSEQLTAGSICTVTANGFTNRALSVSGNAVLDIVCFASCNACDVVAANYNVTFRVDMNGVAGFTTPEVNGTFNGWCGNCNPMSDIDGDGIWEATLSIPEGTHEFKYAYDNWAGSEQLMDGQSCTINTGGFVNRSLNVTSDLDLAAVCWASCNACSNSTAVDVIFRVDMSQVTTAFTTPEVNGTFNNWCGGCAPMSDADGDNVWELTISLEPGTYEFKYAYDSWAGSETLAPGSSCVLTTGQFTNRLLTVTDAMDLGVVCWGSCTACDNPTGPFNVTFSVNMADYTGAFTTPELNGTFNNWCGNCAMMSDADGDNIWEITIGLNTGSYEYKFSHDNWTGQEALVDGSACTINTDGFINRTLEVSGPTVLETVCWNSCIDCEDFVLENRDGLISLYPNPAVDQLNFGFAQPTAAMLYTVYSSTGAIVYQQSAKGTMPNSIDISQWSNGIYALEIKTAEGSARRKFIVQH